MPPHAHAADAPLAHGPGHGLTEHLHAVAQGAAQFAPAAARDWARLAGLWHDLGKFRPGFQRYIRMGDDAHIEGRGVGQREKSHSAAGALHALQVLEQRHGPDGRRAGWLLAQLIAAHHAGLYDAQDLRERLHGSSAEDSRQEYDEAHAACAAHAPELLPPPADLATDTAALVRAVPGLAEREELAQSLWLRMQFSALVDADFLDTEAYLNRGQAQARAGFPPLADYLSRLDTHLNAMAHEVQAQGRADDSVMRARAQVLADCRAAAQQAPGVFGLQVPTGGGKTLASLAFALRHAVQHGLQRVIVAIPYTSIVEQTANVLAGIFGRDHLVEHHSQADSAPHQETARSRLACENWDAPLIVTTNVQLFESLFAARTSRCRKLHRVQRSVIILDEAQTLPPPFLQPTLDALRLLAGHHGCSIVSCTATQPVLSDIERFDKRRSLRGLVRGGRPREIVQAVAPLYAQLERVRLHWPADLLTAEPLPGVAVRLAAEPAVLAIVGTRSDAQELVQALDAAAPDAEPTLHLSAALCGQHRADVIRQIRDRLDARRNGDTRPLRVVATQLVEAGVDIDFPVVFRALAGLDAIAQAAGRCNREGRLGPGGGRVEVFVREAPRALAALVRAQQATRSVLGSERPATLAPELFDAYFRHWYGEFNTLDEKGIGNLLRGNRDFDFQFRSAAEAYRLIDDADQVAVVVPYTPADGRDERAGQALAALKQGEAERWQLRLLQRYVVQARRRTLADALARGELTETLPGWCVLNDATRYCDRFGLLAEGAPLDSATLCQ